MIAAMSNIWHQTHRGLNDSENTGTEEKYLIKKAKNQENCVRETDWM